MTNVMSEQSMFTSQNQHVLTNKTRTYMSNMTHDRHDSSK